MLSDILLPLIGGLMLLALGGEALVSGAVATARRLDISPIVIGVILIGFGTSAPELLTSVQAAREGSPEIALGNVLGSNTANVLLVGGLAAMIVPMVLDREALRFDLWIAVSAIATLALAMVANPLTPMLGALFLLSLGLYALVGIATGMSASPGPDAELTAVPQVTPNADHPHLGLSLVLAAAGLGGTILGAGLFVDGAVGLAWSIGLSEAVIGASIVAVGTSLPELATSVMAARRGEAGLAVANVIGSNIFNVLGVLGAVLILGEIDPVPEAVARDLPAALAATGVLIWVVLVRGGLGRKGGAALVALYAAYLWLMF